MRSLREYKHITRQPTAVESIAIQSAAESLKRIQKEKMIGFMIQIAVFCFIAAVLIFSVSPLIAGWFKVILWLGYVCMTGYLLYDALDRYINMRTSLYKVIRGEYRVANGKMLNFTGLRFGHCVVEGEIGDTNKAVIQFNISSDFIEQECDKKDFLCFMTNMQAYVFAALPNGGRIVTDDVDVYELQTASI